MNKILLSISIIGLAAYPVLGATVPAGATLVVRTQQTISSQDRVGKPISARLDRDVGVNGKVVLHKGAKVTCRIASSSALSARRSPPLAVNITEIAINDRMIPIKTAGAVEPKSGWKTPGGVPVFGSSFKVPTGTKMEFLLAQPLNL